MKKALYIICLFFVSVLFAEEFSYGDFLYKINENDEVILTKCKITNGFVQIPSEINGKKVTTIENDIFKYGNYISSIEIPDSVEKIYSGVFSTCQSLVSVTLSENNENFAIIDNILYNKKEKSVVSCFSTKANIVIPYGIEKIGNMAFSKCEAILSVNIPDTVTEILPAAFSNCSKLITINIPDSVKKIGDGVFFGCTSLEEISISNSVEVIGNGVFAGCDSLKNVNIPEDNEKYVVLDNILYNKKEKSLLSCFSRKKNIVIPYGIEKIERRAFEYCTSISGVDIPSSVKIIGSMSFFGCYSLSAIAIPDSVEIIEYWAFGLCKGLASFYVYHSVPCIEEKIFLDNDYVVVHCNEGTSVEKYCQENNIKYSITPEWLK